MKAKSLAYLKEEEPNPYIARVNAAILEDGDSTTDEMLIQKTFKGAGTILGTRDDLEKFHIQSAKDFNIDWFVKWSRKLQSLGVQIIDAFKQPPECHGGLTEFVEWDDSEEIIEKLAHKFLNLCK